MKLMESVLSEVPLLTYNTIQYGDDQGTDGQMAGASGSQVTRTPSGVSSYLAIEKRTSQGPDRIQPSTTELPDQRRSRK